MKCFNSENNPYICLQLFRILVKLLDLKARITDNPLIKYIDEQLHIENDYLFSLDFIKYNVVPDFVIPRCSEFLHVLHLGETSGHEPNSSERVKKLQKKPDSPGSEGADPFRYREGSILLVYIVDHLGKTYGIP